MGMEVGMEDDLFFADLNRQISLLIDDDHDHHHHHHHHHHHASFPPQIYTQLTTPMLAQPQYLYQENCGREYLVSSKGTGVFIPQRPQLRRKSRDQRKRVKSSNTQQQQRQQQQYDNYNIKRSEN